MALALYQLLSSAQASSARARARVTKVLIVLLIDSAQTKDGPGVVELAIGAHPMMTAPFWMPASVQERLGAHKTRGNRLARIFLDEVL